MAAVHYPCISDTQSRRLAGFDKLSYKSYKSYKSCKSMLSALLTMEERMLTTGEVARYCGVHFRTVLRWIDKGRLKAHRLPGTRADRRIRLSDFLLFLHENNLPVPAELQPAHHRVLVVEDEQPMARAIERVLRRAGFETRIALDGFQAGVLLQSYRPRVMTLDLKMTNFSGFEVLDFIRAHPELSAVRVLVVSALDTPELERAQNAGADAVLSKPFDSDELAETVSRLAGITATQELNKQTQGETHE